MVDDLMGHRLNVHEARKVELRQIPCYCTISWSTEVLYEDDDSGIKIKLTSRQREIGAKQSRGLRLARASGFA